MFEKSSDLKEKLLNSIAQIEHSISRAKFTVKDKLHVLEPIMIMPYYGFGNDTYVYLKGRVLEDEKVKQNESESSVLQHLANTYKRYESDEIPGIGVRASFAGQDIEVKTDDEGFFQVEFRFDMPIDYDKHGTTVKLRLLESKTADDKMEAEGKIFVPDKNAEFGIISDIDDTVLVSNVTHFLGRLKLMLLKSASKRSPFPGIAAFLRALCKGYDSKGRNPLFFVSGSEWNLFDLLVSFFRYHNIPEGPLLLRDKGTRFDRGELETSESEYKREKIRHILATYPHLNFICIGDNGQHDPEIYRSIQHEYPDRLPGIYIRDVSPDRRDKQVHRIAKEVQGNGAEMLLIEETLTAAEHALRMKWINEEQLADIKQECERDEQGESQ